MLPRLTVAGSLRAAWPVREVRTSAWTLLYMHSSWERSRVLVGCQCLQQGCHQGRRTKMLLQWTGLKDSDDHLLILRIARVIVGVDGAHDAGDVLSQQRRHVQACRQDSLCALFSGMHLRPSICGLLPKQLMLTSECMAEGGGVTMQLDHSLQSGLNQGTASSASVLHMGQGRQHRRLSSMTADP